MTWTILIPTLGQRNQMLSRLLTTLLPQVEPYRGAVRVLAYYNNGSPSLAHIRQTLVEAVRTPYMSFVDDDDGVPDYFVDETMAALASGPDYVGWQTQYYADGVKREPLIDQSLRHERWYEDRRTGALYRDITHINPMRTSIARLADFRRVRPGRAEDRAWVAQLRGKLRTEVYIDKIMYHYFWTSTGTSWQHPERIQPGPRLEVDHPYFRYHHEGGAVQFERGLIEVQPADGWRRYQPGEVSPVPPGPDKAPGVDLTLSLRSLAINEHVQGGMLKMPADLRRYQQIIAATRPQVIVETGTLTGASALWFASYGLDVITVDVDPQMPDWAQHDRITYVVGDSADPAVARYVRELVAGRRCMVSLDSDHSAAHVTREIELYGPLVSPGCYLVVEDGILGHAPPSLLAQHGMRGMVGSPLDAIAARLAGATGWTRDLDIEQANPVTHHVAGWWRRDG